MISRISHFFYSLLFLSVFFYGCSDGIVTECDIEEPDTNNLSSFANIQERVFDQSCALAGCHAGSAVQANLNLEAGQSYKNLVNVNSLLNPEFKRVEPGNSGESFLIKALRNTGESTSQMPPSGKLPDSIIDSIALWIDNGAFNN